MSLSISDGEPASKNLDGQSSFIDTNYWIPSLPRPDFRFLGIDPTRYLFNKPETPISMAIFGPDALALRRVSRIRVLLGRHKSIQGIEVLYSHGIPSVRLGKEWTEDEDGDDCQRILDIDGEGGEYIMAIDVTTDTLYGNVDSLKVSSHSLRSHLNIRDQRYAV